MDSNGKCCVCPIFTLNYMNDPVIPSGSLCMSKLLSVPLLTCCHWVSQWTQSWFYQKQRKYFHHLCKEKNQIQHTGTEFSIQTEWSCFALFFFIFILLLIVQSILLEEYQSIDLTLLDRTKALHSANYFIRRIAISFYVSTGTSTDSYVLVTLNKPGNSIYCRCSDIWDRM